MFCREQVARFVESRERIEQAGAGLVAIGNGTLDMARRFPADYGQGITVLTDPERASYAAFGMKRNFGIGPRTLARASRALLDGHRQGQVQGDPWQQGGVLVLAKGGALVYRHVNTGAGDHAPMAAVFEALGV